MLVIGSVALIVGASLAVGASQMARPAATGPAPEASAWLAAARDGTPLALDLGPMEVDVIVHLTEGLFAPGADVRDASGTRVAMDGIVPLAGQVVGFPGSIVRITVFEGSARGMAIVPGLGAVSLAPTADGGPGMTRLDAPPVFAPRAFDEEPGLVAGDLITSGHSLTGCLHLTPHAIASPVGLVLGWPTRTYGVGFAVDSQFEVFYGAGWAGVATTLINLMDGFYTASIGLRIQALDLHSHDTSVLQGASTSVLLTQMASHYGSAHAGLAREGAHLFSGKDLGTVVGQANCIGGAGTPTVAYTVGMAAHCDPIDFVGLSWFPDCPLKISSHEVGHILSAHHHYANCATKASPPYDPFVTFDVCTLMINDIGLASMEFSTTNRLVTRGWADSVGL